MNYSALIVAAGSGNRMGLGYNKLFYTLQSGETIIEKTVWIFKEDERCKEIVVVTSLGDMEHMKELFHDSNIIFVEGGATRQDSVKRGLNQIHHSYVMIHDGARPWVCMECLNRIVDTLNQQDACLLMMPVKDTIKEVVNGVVVQTYQRDNLRLAQTPQAFKTSLIIDCYKKAEAMGVVASDDAQVVELCSNVHVYEVEGSYENLKVTTREDIEGK